MKSNTALGITFNIIASALFALMYGYTYLLTPLSGEAIYGWRILLTVPCLTLFILAYHRKHEILTLFQRIRHERGFWLTRLISSALLGVQLWLFMWAPVNGYGLDVSLGYFLLPICMVILGRVACKDHISRFQLLACVLAAIGIGYQILLTTSLSWTTFVVCLAYPWYFWLRRITNTNTLGGLWLDMTISLPLSLFFILHSNTLSAVSENSALPYLILGLALISASALACQAISAPHLNLTLFGLLIYVEPVLLIFVSLLLGENIQSSQLPAYIAIWVAVLLLITEGIIALRKRKKVAIKS